MAKIQESIESKLKSAFSPTHLEVVNESHTHNVPENSETHFKVLIVSSDFEGLSRIKRQQSVYAVLDEELKGEVHALTQRALTPDEFQKSGAEGFVSPDCRGGSKK